MRTVAKLFFLFTVVTAIEVFLLLKLAEATSWWVTVATIFVPGLLGAWLAKREGARAFREVLAALSLQREPTGAIVDGAIVLVASVLLITPGVLTDLTGLMLLVPPVRRTAGAYARRRLTRAIDRRFSSGSVRVFGVGGFGGDGGGDFEVIDAEDIPKPR
jgi:UPF0716 protein FxsA